MDTDRCFALGTLGRFAGLGILLISCARGENLQRLPAPIEKSAAVQAQAELTQQRSALAKGKEIQSSGEPYVFLPDMKAQASPVKAAKADGSDLPTKGDDTPEGEQKGRFLVYEAKAPDGSPQKLALKTDEKGQIVHPTALNSRTQQIGVVTGIYNVQLQDISKADELAKSYSLKLMGSFAPIRRAYFAVAPDVDMLDLLDKIKADARVEEAEIEVLENFKSAK